MSSLATSQTLQQPNMSSKSLPNISADPIVDAELFTRSFDNRCNSGVMLLRYLSGDWLSGKD